MYKDDLRDPTDQILARQQLIDELTAASEGRDRPPNGSVEGLDSSFQNRILERKQNPSPNRFPMGQLAEGMNGVLDDRELYSESAWPTAAKRRELETLLEAEPASLSESDLQRRNRRLVELAFPGTIRGGEGNVIWIGYAGLKVSEPLPLSRKQIEPFFEGAILLVILKIGLGIVGIFIGIVVTSPIIPELFQVGSMHLLLSKPISRSWLLIAKFIGGTAFIAMNVTYLLIGFYWLVGWRLDIWNVGILYCIPSSFLYS